MVAGEIIMKAYRPELYHSGGYRTTERIYTLTDPRSNTIFYIGKTRKPPADRLWGHIAAARKKGGKFRNNIKDALILEILASGKKPFITMIETISSVSYIEYLEIPEREIYWMKKFKKEGHPLMNIMGLRIPQPNSEYLWYLECKEKGSVPAKYYFCGKDKDGDSLYHKERILADGMAWKEEQPVLSEKRYNPYDNPTWRIKMGL